MIADKSKKIESLLELLAYLRQTEAEFTAAGETLAKARSFASLGASIVEKQIEMLQMTDASEAESKPC